MVVSNWITANIIWITIAIGIIVALYFVFVIIQIIRKKRRFGSQLTIILIILGLMFLIFLTYRAGELEGADWGQVILMIGLVSVTALYASSTEKMAREMKEQRQSEAQPYLLIRLQDKFVKLDPTEQNKIPEHIKITIRNVGKGPAINITTAFWHPDGISPFQIKGYLTPQEEWESTINTVKVDLITDEWLPELKKIIKEYGLGTVAIKYNDIHGINWITYLHLMRFIGEGEYVGEGEQSIIKGEKDD